MTIGIFFVWTSQMEAVYIQNKMKIEISRREVLSNLILFKESLACKKSSGSPLEERTYFVLLNQETGDMRFSQSVQSLEHRMMKRGSSKEALNRWKEAFFTIGKEPKFGLIGREKKTLDSQDFSPLAWKIIQETLRVLNMKAYLISGSIEKRLIEEMVLEDLSSLELSGYLEEIASLPSWQGSLGRFEAEKKLEGHTVGTYLLRDGDELTQSIGFHFSEENHLFVHPFLVTVVDQDEKISDILMIQTSRGWTFYHDDPNLNDPILYQYKRRPEDLLDEIKDVIKDPMP